MNGRLKIWPELGAIATSAGVSISLTNVEQYLRIASLVIGLTIGVISLVSTIRNKRKVEPIIPNRLA